MAVISSMVCEIGWMRPLAVGAGCWGRGVPLFWRNACLGYSMQREASRKISYEDAANALSTAFTRWTGATCPTEGTGRSRTSIDVRDLGPAECGNVEYKSGVANQNVIVFRDETWKYGKTVLGLTTVVYNPVTGEIYNAGMEINTLDMQPLAVRDPVREAVPGSIGDLVARAASIHSSHVAAERKRLAAFAIPADTGHKKNGSAQGKRKKHKET